MEKTSFVSPLFTRLALLVLALVCLQSGLKFGLDWQDYQAQPANHNLKQDAQLLAQAISPMVQLARWDDASPLLELVNNPRQGRAAYLYKQQQPEPKLMVHTNGLAGFNPAIALTQPQMQAGFSVYLQAIMHEGKPLGQLMLVSQSAPFDYLPYLLQLGLFLVLGLFFAWLLVRSIRPCGSRIAATMP